MCIDGGTLAVSSSTIDRNFTGDSYLRGGGIYCGRPGTVALDNTIVALNTADVFGPTSRARSSRRAATT